MIEPKDVEIAGKIFTLSKFPAIEGREIISKYPLSGLPKLGDYAVNQETMLKLMSYVGVPVPNSDSHIMLRTKELVNNQTGSWETLLRVEWAMLEYNCTFFQNGRISSFFQDIAQKLPAWISKILTDSLAQLSQTEKPPSEN